ncbi:MAG: hypothetical protein COY73_00160 [Candidatus Nealsonbacteria bacterium CG_4_10_14_0_8_um_filter_37_14]|uniref:Uncharacterized protein n=1 Tax=Candidatus Nealsonbacteria bacterium CG_4_10_14_0_8_um_filter_37_14 TaxID=1974684 RepID=A0A2M7R779_9BACT|nr:MAG: hypothetical protein COV63_00815 [Candidatus Nealsonbacteria bacterium CG11_big_fil_rev_8_21_14_0_20_37_68]PIY89700.1 MAG: hypothetical protein COY73_00160 [Candidatus Nealsonbacteria bacterium CG_4_10_14_0_8_um_filter_37_14]
MKKNGLVDKFCQQFFREFDILEKIVKRRKNRVDPIFPDYDASLSFDFLNKIWQNNFRSFSTARNIYNKVNNNNGPL